MDDVHLLIGQLERVHLFKNVDVTGMKIEQELLGLVEEFVEGVAGLCRPACWKRQALH